MSRTDATNPWWTTADPIAVHSKACRRHHNCDLRRRPTGRAIAALPRMTPVDPAYCGWTVKHPWRPAPPPSWFRHTMWYGPQRATSRVDCRRAAAEYRATGEVDTIPPTMSHRHSARWDWN